MRIIISKWRRHPGARTPVFVIILFTATILAYRPAWHGGFLWDDDAYVTNNELLTAPDGLRRIWFSLDSPSQYFPLVYTSFRFEHALWGLNPTGYHIVNILLHAANALLLWRLLMRLRIPGAWIAAAVFALHPVQVESVAWITERKNVLMGFFFLLSLLAWVEFVDEKTKRPWLFYLLALASYTLALFSKSTACTLPAALLLIVWLQKKPINGKRLLQTVPFFVLGFGMGLLAMWWERYHQGTRGALFGLAPRVFIASHAVWFYLAKLLWPSKLTFIYPRWQIDPGNPVTYSWLLGLAGLAVAIYFVRRYTGRSVEVATLFFVATLSPVLGFIMLYTFRYTFVADHYQYLACIGPIALGSAAIVKFGRRFSKGRSLTVALALSLLGCLCILTWQQSAMYGNIEELWRVTLRKNPGCWMAHNNLGIVLFQKGETDEAISHYRTTLSLAPDFWDAAYNLGNALLKKGQVDEALAYCSRAVAGEPHDPDAQVALANALFEKQQIDEAIVHYKQALAVRPDYFLARHALGHAFLLKGELDSAISQCWAAVQIQPENTEAQTDLAVALDEKGEISEAVMHYEKALGISPQSVSAANNLAWILATSSDVSLRNPTRALELAQKADALSHGDNAIVLHTLAAACAASGSFSSAVEVAQKALAIARAQGDSGLADALEQEVVAYQARLRYDQIPK